MEWLRIYSDLISNIFNFLSLNLFVCFFSICTDKRRLFTIKLTYLLGIALISIIPDIPFSSLILIFSELLYICFIVKGNFRAHLFLFFKYEVFYTICDFTFTCLHLVITKDINVLVSNNTYAEYSFCAYSFLTYIILSIYIIIHKLSAFPQGQTYKRYFLAVMGSMIAVLFLCIMLLGSNMMPPEEVLPFMFSLLLIITLLCITIYQKIIDILEENTLAKIEAQTNALQQDYYAHIESNLKTLSSLRHDFKNHLLVLDGHARAQETEKLLDYIQSIHQTYESANLIQTPSTALSALLNAKNEICRLKGVSLLFTQSIPELVIDDFHLVTIMSNLLDNAITAAAKCPNGTITLQMIQLDSHLEIDCVNSHQEKLLPKGDIFLTTKEHQKEIHGLGITSMRKTVEALHGSLSIDYTDDTFHVAISVPNYR